MRAQGRAHPRKGLWGSDSGLGGACSMSALGSYRRFFEHIFTTVVWEVYNGSNRMNSEPEALENRVSG